MINIVRANLLNIPKTNNSFLASKFNKNSLKEYFLKDILTPKKGHLSTLREQWVRTLKPFTTIIHFVTQ